MNRENNEPILHIFDVFCPLGKEAVARNALEELGNIRLSPDSVPTSVSRVTRDGHVTTHIGTTIGGICAANRGWAAAMTAGKMQFSGFSSIALVPDYTLAILDTLHIPYLDATRELARRRQNRQQRLQDRGR